METAGLPQRSIEVMLQHHKRYDGSGYPSGLTGKDISLGGRIVAIADVYDALTSDRPYRKGWPHEKTCQFILDRKGKDFDSELVDIFLELTLVSSAQ